MILPPPPTANESRRVRARDDMADVYDGVGEGRLGSPRSPTRPYSMRRRQSMQVLELEARLERLAAENSQLTDSCARSGHLQAQAQRSAKVAQLKQSLLFLHEVARLTEVNDGLASANAELAARDSSRRAEASEARDSDMAGLRARLDAADGQIRDLKQRLIDAGPGPADVLDLRDDYFDSRCRQLCAHLQQWVLRFSKFSDLRACCLARDVADKTVDRLDNAVLDGSDVYTYLADRVKRRDVFMSVAIAMIWEFVFTRYLFGMDRDQRQKLKSLEKLLVDIGPASAVRQWRAVTLTLLSKRDAFQRQRELDTEAVVQAVFQTLSSLLPPPARLEMQIESQLRRVVREAVDLFIQMRTQRAEYMMLPPLQPEYDADGELAAPVRFDAAMMNERSGSSSASNDELEAQRALVRIVLFPLVVKRGDDAGIGDKIVVCPTQVLVARASARSHATPSSDAGDASLGAPSHLSVVTNDHSLAAPSNDAPPPLDVPSPASAVREGV